MSAEEVSALREDIAEIQAIMRERALHSDRNGKFLHAIAAAVLCQLAFTIYYAGARSMQLDRLTADVHDLQVKILK